MRVNILEEEKLAERSAELGAYTIDKIREMNSPLVQDLRGAGLWIGIDIDPTRASARAVCEALKLRGLLCKETHETVVRLAPPLTITKDDIDWALSQIQNVFKLMEQKAAA